MRTDREKQGLRGPVKTMYVETAEFKEQDGQVLEKPWFSHTFIFDLDGWLVEQANRNPDGSEWRTVNDYTAPGKLLTTKSYAPSGALVNEIRYVYDDEGRLVAEQHTAQGGGMTTPTTYAYDGEGRKIKIQELDQPGEADLVIGIEGTSTGVSAREAKRVETRYDARDEAVEVKVFNSGGALVSRVEINRDERGNPLEETHYVGDSFPVGPCEGGSCSPGEAAALTAEQQAEIARLFSPGTALSTHVHRYDEEGRLIESKLTMMGMEAWRQTFAYDKAGNKAEEVNYDGDGASGSKAIFTREYDEHGNWTKELVSTASSWDAEFGLATPVHVTRRTITYYE